MAERAITGKDIVMKLDLEGGTSYDTIICLTSNTVGITVEQIDSITKCGNKKLPGNAGYTATFEGELMVDPDTGTISAAEIFAVAKAKTTVGFYIGPATAVEGDPVYTGTAFIASLEQTFGVGDPATFSGELGILEDITLTITPA